MVLARRALLQLTPYVLATASASSVGATSKAARQRSYRGQLRYSWNGRETGRESFAVTIQPSGLRILQAHCELDDDRLQRDVLFTVDADWRPVTAFIQLTVDGQMSGATWYHFSRSEIVVEGQNAVQGRISKRVAIDEPVDAFGTHPIHGDAWNLARLRRNGGQTIATPRFSSSAASNGGTGPDLVLLPANHVVYALAGQQNIRVAAGAYATTHFTMTVTPKKKTNHIWAYGQDCIPVRMTTPEGRRYELQELGGDPL